MQPCTAQRSAQEEQPPEQGEEERPREHGDGSSGPRQSIGATAQWKNEEKRRRIANWSEMMQQMVATSCNVEECSLEHQEELSKRWRVATRSETVSGEDSRRPMVVTSLVAFWLGFGACSVENDSSACDIVRTYSLYRLWSSWSGAGWKKKRTEPLG